MGMNFPVIAAALIVLIAALLLSADSSTAKLIKHHNHHHHHHHQHKHHAHFEEKQCDVSDGKWVHDSAYPLYNPMKCPFIDKPFNCIKNGRINRDYQKYRWQPNHCHIPRWNGTDFLMKIKTKKVMFVGDSMSLNQFQSLICMINSANPHLNHTYSRKGSVSTFKIPALKVSISFLRNALLVDLIKVGNKRVLKLDSVQKSSAAWKGNDILIFDSWHWWLHSGRKQMWDEIHFGKIKVKDMTRLVAYEIGLQTWARWVHKNVDSKRARIFFQGVSPDHDSGREWGQPNSTHCIAEQRPLTLQAYPGGPHPADVVLNRVLKGLKKRVRLLNISKLSQLRVDGHPHIYVTASRRAIDCTHWCLPGVPDTWNQLLYASL